MSTARARANHKLYLARILLGAWRTALDAADIPASTLNQAYAPAVRRHLLEAYGWFLLEISHPALLPEQVPGSVAELPELAEGRALAGELREFQRLERESWLADLLQEPDEWSNSSATAAPSAPNLASSVADMPDVNTQAHWADHLEALFDRMGDSLDEY